ncbi:MAG: DUF255 domain-containing protein [Phycisphaeraceae bacterium]
MNQFPSNRLARETSPYLLQHAHNPVDWYPWGPEAFERSRAEQRPIFLSIGYSTCYWCHVMEREVFEKPAMAELMNRHFINIKVDREERPDVDDVYMAAVQAMTRRGGWPMSVFLTPPGAKGRDDRGLRPFWCATYIPPAPAHGMPGFPQVIDGLSNAWASRRDEVLEQADQLAAMVTQQLEQRDESGEMGLASLEASADQLRRMLDHQHGGTGGSPKFPQASLLGFQLAISRQDERLREHLHQTLDRMARGGIYDQIGGGFHRYAVDERWLVPHFEKMLYDNGQLLWLYAAALEAEPDHPNAGLYTLVIRETAAYLKREMLDKSGAFWSAQDAEVDAREGGNYLWRREELDGVFTDPELRGFAERLLGLDLGVNFQDPHHDDDPPANVLFMPQPFAEIARREDLSLESFLARRQQVRETMRQTRDQRKQPGTDDKVLVCWNGLAIAGLARSGRVLNDPSLTEMAKVASEAILQHMTRDDGGLYRTMRAGQKQIPAFLDDYAFMISGLIELQRADPSHDTLSHALRLLDRVNRHFAAPAGGYFDISEGHNELFVRTCSRYDGALPTGNAQMAHNLIDLYELAQDQNHLDAARSLISANAESLDRMGVGMVHLQHALQRFLVYESNVTRPAPRKAHRQGPVTARLESVERDQQQGRIDAVLIVEIEEGFHVYAPGGEANGLQPITVRLSEANSSWQLTADWPTPTPQDNRLSSEPLSVYEGVVRVPLRLQGPASADEPVIVLSHQACSGSECQAPEKHRLILPAETRA